MVVESFFSDIGGNNLIMRSVFRHHFSISYFAIKFVSFKWENIEIVLFKLVMEATSITVIIFFIIYKDQINDQINDLPIEKAMKSVIKLIMTRTVGMKSSLRFSECEVGLYGDSKFSAKEHFYWKKYFAKNILSRRLNFLVISILFKLNFWMRQRIEKETNKPN